MKHHSALITSLTEVNTNYVQQQSLYCAGTRNTYIHMRMKQTQYFNVSHYGRICYVLKSTRFREILDLVRYWIQDLPGIIWKIATW